MAEKQQAWQLEKQAESSLLELKMRSRKNKLGMIQGCESTELSPSAIISPVRPHLPDLHQLGTKYSNVKAFGATFSFKLPHQLLDLGESYSERVCLYLYVEAF